MTKKPRLSSRAPRTPEAHLRRLLDGKSRGAAYHWHHVLAIAEAITAERSPERERLLCRVALFNGRFHLDATHGLSHAMPPEDVFRCIAVVALGRWNRRKHRTVIRRVRDNAEREAVIETARSALGD